MLKNKDETHHSLLSSLFTYRIVADCISRSNLWDHPAYGYLPVLAFLAVKRHHGNLGNLRDEMSSLSDPNFLAVAKRQLDSIEPGAFDSILTARPEVEFDLASFRREIEDCLRKMLRAEKAQVSDLSEKSQD